METIFVTAPFPAQLEYRARLEAARLRISRAELVRLAVMDYLQRLEAGACPLPPQEITDRNGN